MGTIIVICNGCGGQGKVFWGTDKDGKEIYKICYPCNGTGYVYKEDKND